MNKNKPTVDFDYFDTEAEVNGSIKLPLETGRKILDLLLDAAKPSSLGQIKPKSEVYIVAPSQTSFDFSHLTKEQIEAALTPPVSEAYFNNLVAKQAQAKMSAEAGQDVMLPKTEPVVSKSHNMSANNPLIIMFNAPPQSGKDTCADAIMSAFKGVRKVNFKDSLYKRSAAILGYDLAFWTSICQNNDLKDKPMHDIKIGAQIIRNATPRDMLIAVAEKVIKPEFGNNIFAVDALNSIRQHMSNNIGGNIFVMPDCGFDYEADVIKGAFPNAKVVVVQIEREGHTFDNDSRDWVPCDHILYNRGLEALQKDVLSLVGDLLIESNVKTMAVK